MSMDLVARVRVLPCACALSLWGHRACVRSVARERANAREHMCIGTCVFCVRVHVRACLGQRLCESLCHEVCAGRDAHMTCIERVSGPLPSEWIARHVSRSLL
eukprot:6718502-Alexandrium_andersonii.AAC.1